MPNKTPRPYASESMLDPRVEAKIHAQLKEQKELDGQQEIFIHEIKVLIPGLMVKRLKGITLDFGKPNPYDET